VDLCKAVVEPGRYSLEGLDGHQYPVVSGDEDEKKKREKDN